MVNINASKASRAREKAQDADDGAHTAQFNQLWEYCDELRRCSLGSTVLMKVHTYNDGDLTVKHELATGLPYFEKNLHLPGTLQEGIFGRVQANHWYRCMPSKNQDRWSTDVCCWQRS